MSMVASALDKASNQRRWWVLAIVVGAQFMFVVDGFVVNVAIPSIRIDLHATTGQIQSVIAIYQIAFAGVIIAGGRLGDVYGPKPVFLIGVTGFTLASLLCGLCQSGAELVAARAIQGVTAAIMVPQVLATIHVLFLDEERGRAFGIFGFTLGLGMAVGFALGGVLVSLNLGGSGWRSIFFVNLPVGAALLTGGLRLMPYSAGRTNVSIDVLGAVTLFCALLCVVAPLSLGSDFHWTAPVFIVLVLGLLLLLLMWPLESWVEHSRQRLPILHLDLFRDLSFILGLTAIFFFTFSNQSFYLVLTLYLQTGLELPPLQSGLTVLPLTLAFAGVSRVAGPRAQRRGVSALIEGCGVQIVGLFLLGGAVGLFDRLSPVLTALLLIVFGAGQAMVMAPLYGLVLARVPQAHAGSGGGVVSTVQQVGNSCGVVATGLIFYAIQHSHSVRLAMGASVSLLVLALCITAAMLGTLRRHKSSDQRATSGFDLDHEFGAE